MEANETNAEKLAKVKADARAFAEGRAEMGEAHWLREMETFLIIEDEDTRLEAVSAIANVSPPPFEAVARWAEDARPKFAPQPASRCA